MSDSKAINASFGPLLVMKENPTASLAGVALLLGSIAFIPGVSRVLFIENGLAAAGIFGGSYLLASPFAYSHLEKKRVHKLSLKEDDNALAADQDTQQRPDLQAQRPADPQLKPTPQPADPQLKPTPQPADPQLKPAPQDDDEPAPALAPKTPDDPLVKVSDGTDSEDDGVEPSGQWQHQNADGSYSSSSSGSSNAPSGFLEGVGERPAHVAERLRALQPHKRQAAKAQTAATTFFTPPNSPKKLPPTPANKPNSVETPPGLMGKWLDRDRQMKTAQQSPPPKPENESVTKKPSISRLKTIQGDFFMNGLLTNLSSIPTFPTTDQLRRAPAKQVLSEAQIDDDTLDELRALDTRATPFDPNSMLSLEEMSASAEALPPARAFDPNSMLSPEEMSASYALSDKAVTKMVCKAADRRDYSEMPDLADDEGADISDSEMPDLTDLVDDKG